MASRSSWGNSEREERVAWEGELWCRRGEPPPGVWPREPWAAGRGSHADTNSCSTYKHRCTGPPQVPCPLPTLAEVMDGALVIIPNPCVVQVWFAPASAAGATSRWMHSVRKDERNGTSQLSCVSNATASEKTSGTDVCSTTCHKAPLATAREASERLILRKRAKHFSAISEVARSGAAGHSSSSKIRCACLHEPTALMRHTSRPRDVMGWVCHR